MLANEESLKLHVTPVTCGEAIPVRFAQCLDERIAILGADFAVNITMASVKARLLCHYGSPLIRLILRTRTANVAGEAASLAH